MMHNLFLCNELPVGRCAYSDLPQSSRMELVVTDLKDNSLFRDDAGDFLPLSEWYGVEFDSEGNVIEVTWEQLWQNDSAQINIAYLPESLRRLSLNSCRLQGSFVTNELPPFLQEVDIMMNEFCGEVDIERLPRTLERTQISRNDFSGSIDCTRLPESLENFNAGVNKLSGPLDFSALPEKLMYFDVCQNAFSGTIDLSQIPRNMRHIDLSGNTFEQDILVVSSQADIAWVYLQDNAIGSVVDETGKAYPRAQLSNQ